ncbi:MAG: PTS system mannose/fructose/sorbose family transporter subunit IID [Gemmatimonadaceae bacterium]|nr:PTS system mannose/fructose/sorbose family transporter subunit IID [Gemmatimonadaceae bacterium]
MAETVVAPTPPTGAPLPTGMRPGPLPVGTRASMLLRCLAIQGAWNYEILNGNGIGFCVEPALRHLPGGVDGDAYRAALARQCAYFNAHPYLASLAVGALARAELDQTPPEKLVRFRTALCGPLGSLGDRLVWAAWLPACSLVALLLFGLGAGPAMVAFGFLVLYNAGHLALRAWGLGAGWLHGLRLASALGANWLQRGPQYIARGAALVAGVALPFAAHRAIGGGASLEPVSLAVMACTPVLGVLLVRLHGKVEGWQLLFGLLALLVLYSTVLH